MDEDESIECVLCGEIVSLDEAEDDACLHCLEREHERQERVY